MGLRPYEAACDSIRFIEMSGEIPWKRRLFALSQVVWLEIAPYTSSGPSKVGEYRGVFTWCTLPRILSF